MIRSKIADILIRLNENEPEKILITEGEHQATVAEIYTGAVALAQNLTINGFQMGDKVVIATAPNGDFVKIIYALIFLQATVAIIDPEMGRDNYKSKLKQINPKWAFVDSRLLLLQEHPVLRYFYLKKSKSNPYFPYMPSAKMIACGRWLPLVQKKMWLKKLFENTNQKEVKWDATNEENDISDFLITYTSGTIDEPKGVVHSFDSLSNSLQLIGNQLDASRENLVATYLPHYMLIAISVKIPAILYNPKLKAVEKLTFFEKNKVSTIMGPPSDFIQMILYCENNKSQFPDTMKHILLGSAPVTRRFLQRLSDVLPTHTRITCLYGMTENLLIATIDGRFKKDYDCEGDLLGIPVENINIKSIDNEIFIKSNQLFSRYFHLDSRSDFHATGDLGDFDKNAFLILKGRKKDMIIRRNLNIYPAIYEATINRIDGVTEAVLVGIYDDSIHDEKVFLVIEGENLKEEYILNKLKSGAYSIDNEALPDKILFMTLPRSGRQHKVNKEAIRDYIKKNKL